MLQYIATFATCLGVGGEAVITATGCLERLQYSPLIQDITLMNNYIGILVVFNKNLLGYVKFIFVSALLVS